MHALETRFKAVVHYTHFERSLRRVSRLYGVSKSSLQRWLKQQGVKKGRTKKNIKHEIHECITHKFAANPFTTLHELSHHIAQECNLVRSRRTLGRYVRQAGFSRKVATRRVDYKHDIVKIRDFCTAFVNAQQTGNLISIDEAGFYMGDHQRKGWAQRGERLCVKSGRSLRRSKFTLLMAVCERGVVGYELMDHNCKKPDFVRFISGLQAPPGSILLMDNIQFHHSSETIAAAHAKGFEILYTPPYSPRMNPIENVFGVIKPKYRHCCPANFTSGFDYEALIRSLINSHNTTDCRPYFTHVLRIASDTLSHIEQDPGFLFDGYG